MYTVHKMYKSIKEKDSRERVEKLIKSNEVKLISIATNRWYKFANA
jgi:hypothetical protein